MKENERNHETQALMEQAKKELPMAPEELLERLTYSAIELYSLGANADSEEPQVFSKAIAALAGAWNLDEKLEKQATATIQRQQEIVAEFERGEGEFRSVVDGEKLFCDPSGKEILAMTSALIQTMVWLERQEERQDICELLGLLRTFWGIEDFLGK
jgi:hypothetical protein